MSELLENESSEDSSHSAEDKFFGIKTTHGTKERG